MTKSNECNLHLLLPPKVWCHQCKLYVRSCTHMTKYERKHKFSIDKQFKDKKNKYWWILEDKSRLIAEVYVKREAILIMKLLEKEQRLKFS